jgi:hypothetical protein
MAAHNALRASESPTWFRSCWNIGTLRVVR